MKKIYYILFISLFFVSCNKETTLSIEETITKEITIPFDSLSIQNNDFIKFKLEKSEHLIVDFSKGKITDNDFIISANDYLADSEPIIVKLSSNVEGTHTFKLIFSELSPDLEADFVNGSNSIEFPNLIVKAKWKAFIPYIIGLIILLLIIIIVFVKKHLKGKTFDDGFLQIAYPEEMQISLEGKRKLSFAKIQNNKDLTAIITCEQKTEFSEEEGGEEEGEENTIKVAQLEVFDDDFFKINNETIDIKTVVLNNGDTIDIFSFDNNKLLSFQYEN